MAWERLLQYFIWKKKNLKGDCLSVWCFSGLTPKLYICESESPTAKCAEFTEVCPTYKVNVAVKWAEPSRYKGFPATRSAKGWSLTSPPLVGLHTYTWYNPSFVSSQSCHLMLFCVSLFPLCTFFALFFFFFALGEQRTWAGGFEVTFYLLFDGNSDVLRPPCLWLHQTAHSCMWEIQLYYLLCIYSVWVCHEQYSLHISCIKKETIAAFLKHSSISKWWKAWFYLLLNAGTRFCGIHAQWYMSQFVRSLKCTKPVRGFWTLYV